MCFYFQIWDTKDSNKRSEPTEQLSYVMADRDLSHYNEKKESFLWFEFLPYHSFKTKTLLSWVLYLWFVKNKIQKTSTWISELGIFREEKMTIEAQLGMALYNHKFIITMLTVQWCDVRWTFITVTPAVSFLFIYYLFFLANNFQPLKPRQCVNA